MELCECGCGGQPKEGLYLRGHHVRVSHPRGMSGKIASRDTRRKQRESHLGKSSPHSQTTIEKIAHGRAGKCLGDTNPSKRKIVREKIALRTRENYEKNPLRRESDRERAREQWLSGSLETFFHKPIRYNERWYRSQPEIDVQRRLDELSVRSQYEPRNFRLSDDLIYRPDFYLPEYDVWIEVKGWMDDEAEQKIVRFGMSYHLELLWGSNREILEQFEELLERLVV
jgi:hypothetical protein